MPEQLYSFLDTRTDQIIGWQTAMTALPALGPENGGTGEHAKARWLTAELEAMGLSDIRQHPCPDDRVPEGFRPNISARVPGKTQRTLWVIAHTDIVPVGEERHWHSPPFACRREGDFIYGRGVEDNQQGIVAGLLTAQALINQGITPDLSLGLLFVADEETGMRYGLPHILRTTPDLISEGDLCIVPDMGDATGAMVETVEKSVLWLRFTVVGKQCHASRPCDGANSLVGASACILALDELHSLFPNEDPLFTPAGSTFVPSKKEANVENVNTLPGKDVFYLDSRVIPEYPLTEVLKECRRIADRIAAQYGVSIDIEPVNSVQAPAATPTDAPVVQRLLAALKELRNLDGVINGSGGQTEASCLRAIGRQAVAWSTLTGSAHAANEHSSLSATIADAKIITRMLFD